MKTRSPEAVHVERLKEVGRYALGVDWADGHDSILPYRTLRGACPCEECSTRSADVSHAPEGEPPRHVEVLGDRSLFLGWRDGHETLLLLEEVRDLCGCARCVGEPDYPVSGR